MLYTNAMTSDEHILVIILSCMLALFLLLSIIVLVMIIQVINRIKHIAERAEDLADKAEAVGEFFQKTAGPAALLKALSRIARSYTHKK